MKLASVALYLFSKTEHTREKKKKMQKQRGKRRVSTAYRPPVDYHHQRQRGVEATLLQCVRVMEPNPTALVGVSFEEQESGLRLLQCFLCFNISRPSSKWLWNVRLGMVLSRHLGVTLPALGQRRSFKEHQPMGLQLGNGDGHETQLWGTQKNISRRMAMSLLENGR